MGRTVSIVVLAALLLFGGNLTARASEYDAAFDWMVVGAGGPLYDEETREGSLFFPGDYCVSASLERSLKILTIRTQVGGFLYGTEIPALHRERRAHVLLSAMDRFGEDRWALIVLGGVGYYDANRQIDFHAGLGFDYRFTGPWVARGEAVYHHEFLSTSVTIGLGYMF